MWRQCALCASIVLPLARVTVVFWFSQDWQRNTRLDMYCVRQHAGTVYSHDNLFHTLRSYQDLVGT
ncbi:hypothetical protein [Lysobacter sp. 22409]|uniref:hypothetical protein n=1 Tax=Lysobacter sp. 22409 TaxID=3453917 RepID=UPI003F8478E5